MAQTLYDKLWDAHLVEQREDGTALIYIDRHLLHEVTSPQAFEGLVLAGRPLWRRSANLAVPDHNVSTLASERQGGLAALPTRCRDCSYRRSMIIAKRLTSRRFL
ncbi:MAG: hypothetical protein CM15mP84_09250 [Cellvibrionales bacterium]|nr:MAG: hypothetical protein CM15mP84_09250 [Cellvibrionales bacterium]